MFKIGTLYRYAYDKTTYDKPTIDNLPNYYYETHVEGFDNTFAFEKGIHPIRTIKGPDGKTRCPVIIISSSPHKAGSDDTPWQDKYESDRGYIRYYGDNKPGGTDPNVYGNNKVLLALKKIYDSGERSIRISDAVPIVFFERAGKGKLCFRGYGILEKAELVTQYDTKKNEYFSNYLFNFCVFTMKEDNEVFNWDWIAKRCDASLTNEETNNYAPNAWKKWVNNGNSDLHLVRRSLSEFDTIKKQEQLPLKGSKEYNRLLDIYHFYDNKKHKFEYLAMEITRKSLERNGVMCVPGWITKRSGDGGVDYVLRMDVGKDSLSGIKIIVLGQAKCTKPENQTNGNDIARTIARLKRGWIGAFVTTSYYSDPLQKELNEDKYPIMLINGKTIAEIVNEELFEQGVDLPTYLNSLEAKYKIEKRMAEDILYA